MVKVALVQLFLSLVAIPLVALIEDCLPHSDLTKLIYIEQPSKIVFAKGHTLTRALHTADPTIICKEVNHEIK